ncbi:hypothetical protein DL766_003492 [Monosporascus sp. MC13-8B]|uniref:Uncharacterized protein n=1 Tax=Monosporascus cannonballus TaxID=155416 RepID=A0ABY0HKA2_9PEZI|nr:hypothetical protein DL763_005362 [Monosporascus cannonballus]RYO95469.1 hypothetical protein DL762_000031 [Monosporascus cannonballus]RYP33361.1 hypothetical protein DL766_003492 [Monosporascus sp. MC13-8B]
MSTEVAYLAQDHSSQAHYSHAPPCIIDNTISSIQVIYDQLNDTKHVIVCVDPVDLDNIWEILWALVRAPSARIHITLSPRVLDLCYGTRTRA